ncbi:DUF2189 domain-containing protein [Rhizobium sp. XQZ8]|uniref:DUF2189 domain-containing protein n=1 Tax=Rhizobium populisoli TaxID=2859785 RepID=UPI001C66D6EE|nr:DUF2189 domain-containing protein [Rhizobium populisoli]MBW6419900.1 DUF2189 domain-containing protein [Rhizobium populisoli]
MTAFHVMAGAHEGLLRPAVRKIGVEDVREALRLGWNDFMERPSHYVFLCLIYPIAGIFLAVWSTGANLMPLLFPLMSGFALLGPIAAIGLYEISRRREMGEDTSWRHALDVRHSPAMPSILAVGFFLVVLFVAWLLIAQALYTAYFGDTAPASIGAFVSDVLTTSQGISMIIWGNLIGFVFAVVVLATTVVAFPLMLDRDVGAGVAIETSVRAALANPVPVALWGLIVAALLVVGTIPIFAGLAVIMPILGHSTWHLYRRLVIPAA